MPEDFAKVKIEGLDDVLRDLRRMKDKDTLNAIKLANRQAAEKVAQQGRVEVPVRKGKLKGSIKPGATAKKGFVRAGTKVNVPYAGPIHFGWFRRHIIPQPFLYRALDKRIQEVFATYQKQIDKVVEKFNRG